MVGGSSSMLSWVELIQAYYSIYYIITMMDFHHQLTVINDSISSEIQASNSVRFISAEKWQALMVKVLHKLRRKEHYDANLIDDLITVVGKMPEQRFIETIMHIEPFKPNFMRKSRRSITKESLEANSDHHPPENAFPYEFKRLQLSKIIKFKQEIHSKVRDSIFLIQQQNPKSGLLEQALTMIRSEATLSKQFQEKYHPFRLIIDQFLFLLEHKYKNVIGSMEGQVNIEHIQEMLLFDLNLLQQFVIKASVPYLQVFKSKNKEEKMEFQIQLIAFIQKYLDRHHKINTLIKKVLKYAVQSSKMYGSLERNIPNFIEIDRFNVESRLQIQGQYSLSINSLIELSQSDSPISSLRKLQELRQSMLQDVDEYYRRSNANLERSQATGSESLGQSSSKSALKISVQNQLQILKFLLCKGKIFVVDILTQLKYLETVLGEEDISYKYDDSSFMYAQLVVAIDCLAEDFQ